MHISKRFVLTWFISILLIVSLLWRANFFEVLETLQKANLQYLGIALLLSVLTLIVKVIRWKLIHSDLKHVKVKDGLAYYSIGMYFSLLTVMKAGDAVKAFLLAARDKIRTSIAIMTVIVDRLLELVAVVLLCIFGFLFYSKKVGFVPIPTELLIGLMLIVILVICLIIAKSEWMIPLIRKIDPFLQRLVQKFTKRTTNMDFEQITLEFGQSFREYIKDSRTLLITIILSIFAWALYTLQFLSVAACFGLYIQLDSLGDWGSIIFIVVSAAIISQLPISIGGIGTRDYAYIILLEALGYATVIVATATLVQSFIGILIPSLIGALLVPQYMINDLGERKENLALQAKTTGQSLTSVSSTTSSTMMDSINKGK
ncbi:MAG: lysylphosphatidylglycerol synthase transmembrane domain-containing protein [Promethearchaeota archaeon]